MAWLDENGLEYYDGKIKDYIDAQVQNVSGGGGSTDWSDITNKPSFATVATSGSYTDLSNKPTIPTKVSDLNNDSGFITGVAWGDVTGKPSTFTPASHNQASNTINALTGYSKPSSTSALATSDTLNGALGKLEKALDGKSSTSHNHDGHYPIIDSTGATACTSNSDFNNYTTAGTYTCTGGNSGSEIHASMSNSPTNGANGGFLMVVENNGENADNIRQTVYMKNGAIYTRMKNGTTWKEWKTVAYTDSDITGNAATATYATNVTTTASAPTSATNYYLTGSTNSATNTGALYKASSLRLYRLTGTASAEGYDELTIGNSTATGTAGNQSGRLVLYNDKGKYTYLRPHTGDTSNRTTYLPKAGGTLVCHTTDTAIGGSDTPVYINASGVATECTGVSKTSHTHDSIVAPARLSSGNINITHGDSKIYPLIVKSAVTGSCGTDAKVLHISWDNDGGYDSQIAFPTSGSTLYFRNQTSSSSTWNAVATQSWVEGKGYVTANNAVTKTSITFPSSATNYYLVADSTDATATGGLSKFGSNARLQVKAGTTSVEGITELILGNSTATGTAGNVTGELCLYNDKGKYSVLKGHTGDTSNRSPIYLPKSTGTLVCHTTDTAIGSASKPVYISASGVATECTSIDSSLYTNTTYTAGTASELTTGTATGTRVWSPKIIADYVKGTASLGTTGNVVLPNGLIVKWGSITSGSTQYKSVTFGTAFPNNCYVAFTTGTQANQSGYGTPYGVKSKSKTGLVIYALASGDGDGGTNYSYNCCWLAIGN